MCDRMLGPPYLSLGPAIDPCSISHTQCAASRILCINNFYCLKTSNKEWEKRLSFKDLQKHNHARVSPIAY